MTQTVTVDRLRAMAAATELLDALKTARRALIVACGLHAVGSQTVTVVSPPYIREALEVIDAALAKAEGPR